MLVKCMMHTVEQKLTRNLIKKNRNRLSFCYNRQYRLLYSFFSFRQGNWPSDGSFSLLLQFSYQRIETNFHSTANKSCFPSSSWRLAAVFGSCVEICRAIRASCIWRNTLELQNRYKLEEIQTCDNREQKWNTTCSSKILNMQLQILFNIENNERDDKNVRFLKRNWKLR